MNILITGATGFVGKQLVKKAQKDGHQIHIVTRSVEQAKKIFKDEEIHFHQWSAPYEDFPQTALHNIDCIINLMGENLAAKRWSQDQKKKLEDSRILGTQKIVEALLKSNHELKSFVQTSAIGFYPVNHSEVLDESSPAGNNYLSNLCVKWENSSSTLKEKTRLSIVRLGLVVGKKGGALQKMLIPFKLGLGGPVGKGEQIISWIHVKDLVNVMLYCATNEKAQGIYNAITPHAISNKVFSESLAKALKRPCLFPVPPIALKMAMGEMSTVVLDGQNIRPSKLINENFKFKYPKIDEAFASIIN